jgi:flagella basal body P-ring formation protein FlgA
LLSAASVDAEGVFLPQLLHAVSNQAWPNLRLCEAPRWGQALVLTRAQIHECLVKAGSDVPYTNWAGATQVRVTRRARAFSEADCKDLLTATLQREHVRDKGTLDLRLTRPWQTVSLPDEALTLKILDLPTTGVSANFIVRFELRTARESLGTWQTAVQARILREVYVARAACKREQLFTEADVGLEPRDLLAHRDALAPASLPQALLEFAEPVTEGAVITQRALRLRAVVRRGQVVEAHLSEGTLRISLKVEVLENGAPGQIVRIRNLQSRRELKGKVQDEQTIRVVL